MSKLKENIDRDMLLERLTRDVISRLRPRAEIMDDHKIGPIGGMLIMSLSTLPPVSLNDVATFMARDKSQITRLVQELLKRGLLQLQNLETDKRVKLVSLTPTGKKAAGKLAAAWRDVKDEVLEPLSDRQRTQFFDLLEVIYPTAPEASDKNPIAFKRRGA